MTAKGLRLALVLSLCLASTVRSQTPKPQASDEAAKTAVVKHLLQLTGVVSVMQKAIGNLIPAERAANPTIPPAFWDAFAARMRQNLPQLADSLVPIYTSRFSLDELKQLEQFYESPTGKHLASAQPDMLAESQQIGQRWGAAIGKGIADSLQAAGVH